MQLTTTVKRY